MVGLIIIVKFIYGTPPVFKDHVGGICLIILLRLGVKAQFLNQHKNSVQHWALSFGDSSCISNEPGELSQWLCHDDSAINIVVHIIIIIIIIEWVKNATISSSIGAPEVVRHDVKHERFFLKLGKFYGHVDYYDKTDQE